jgi:sugar phosphate isomerase/epimerase
MTGYSRRKFLERTAIAAAVGPALGPALPHVSGWFAQIAGPQVHFPADPRERVSVSTYPFREFIIGRDDQQAALGKKIPLKDFPAQIVAKFNVKKIEPWSEHILSRENAYLDELHNAAAKAGVSFANIAADGEHSIYSTDADERRKAVAFGINWIDVAAHLGSPSVRLNIAEDKNGKPDAGKAAEGFTQIASYAAAKNVVVHLENDNPVSEDPFFIAALVDRVNNPWLHALPDFGNSLAALPAEKAYRGLDQMFTRAYAISHVKDTTTTPAHVVVPVDMQRIFAIAKKHYFDGIFSMEWETAGEVYAGTASLIARTIKSIS